MKSKIDFLNGNTKTSLMKMVLPLFAAMVLMLAYNMVDSIWVGNILGENGYAALTTAGSISIILNAIAMGISNGASIVVSQLVGKGKQNEANAAVSTAIVSTGVFCITLIILMEVFLKQLLLLFKTPADIYNDAFGYLRIFLIGYFFVYMYVQFTALFRSYGDSMFQMLGMLAGTILNAIIDPIFIHFAGIEGAAWATALAQFLCFVFVIFYIKKKDYFRFQIKLVNKRDFVEILKNAIPTSIQQCIPAISSMIMVVFVNRYDLTTIAAYGVVKSVENILFYPAMGMNMGLMTIVGQCIGAGRYDRARDYVKTGCIYGGVIEAILTVIVVIFSKGISNMFIKSDDIAVIVSHALLIISIGYVCYMLTSIFMAELSGKGKPMLSMILMLIYYIAIRVPLAAILMKTEIDLDGMWIAILISHIVALIIGFIMVRCHSNNKVNVKLVAEG